MSCSLLFQSYSGLRGAVAFALALIWRKEEGLECFKDDIEEINLRRRMLTAVTTLVMFTVFVQVGKDGMWSLYIILKALCGKESAIVTQNIDYHFTFPVSCTFSKW